MDLPEIAFRRAYAALDAAARADRNAAIEAASAWLEENSAGLPEYNIGAERAAALLWAECASPHEIEAYVVAGVARVENVIWATRQVKRLAGFVWRRMSSHERLDYLEWMKSN